MPDIISLQTETNLFGQEIAEAASIDRDPLAAALFEQVKNITVEQFAALLTNRFEAVVDYANLCAGEKSGQRISLLFSPHRLDTGTKRFPISLYAALKDERFVRGLARVVLLNKKKGMTKDLLYASIGMGVQGTSYVQEFPPHVARDLALEYGMAKQSRILDPCAGWGGRMLGFSAVCDSYTCCEPSTRTAAGLRELLHFIRSFRSDFIAEIHEAPFEDVQLQNAMYDFAMTSPPYYDTEHYAPGEKANSFNRYATFEAWCTGFYAPLIHRTMAALKPGAVFVLNIGSRIYPLNEKLIEIAGTRYAVEKQKGKLSASGGFGKTGEGIGAYYEGETFYEVKNPSDADVVLLDASQLTVPETVAISYTEPLAASVDVQLAETVKPSLSALDFALSEASASADVSERLPETSQSETAEQLARRLAARGHRLLTCDGKFFVSEASLLTEADRAAIKQHRPALIALAEPWLDTPCQRGLHSSTRKGEPVDHGECVNVSEICTICGMTIAEVSWTKAAWLEKHPPAPVIRSSAPASDSLFDEPKSAVSLAQFLGSEPLRPDSNWYAQEPPTNLPHDIVVNFETNGLDWAHGHRPVGVTIGTLDGQLKRYLPFAHKGGGNLDEVTIVRYLQREIRDKHITNANTKFDVHMGRVLGVDFEAQGCTVSDVQHYAALLDDHRKKFALDVLAKDYLGGIEVERIDERNMAEYAASDVAQRAEYQATLVSQLREVMWPLLDKEDLQRVRQLEDDVIYPVVEMEKNGLPIDRALLKQWCTETERLQNECLWNVAKEVGFQVNPDSPADWVRLFEHFHLPIEGITAGGKPSFTDKILKGIDNPFVQLARKAGKLASLRSKFLVAYDQVVGDDHLLRYSLHQLRVDDHGTVRGRFSASDKNIEQVMNHDTHMESFGSEDYFVRRLFVADTARNPNALFLSVDASQIEFRIFAHHSGSDMLLAAYAADPFTSFHKVVWEMIKPLKPDIHYTKTKSLNFLKVYGGGKAHAAEFLELPRAESDKFCDIYDRAFPEVKTTLKKAENIARSRGYVRSILGRRARFPDPNFAYKALNAVIQPTAADIFKTKLVELHRERAWTGFIMRAPNHDEVIGDVPDVESAARVKEILNRQSFPQLKVLILWSGKPGPNWAACK